MIFVQALCEVVLRAEWKRFSQLQYASLLMQEGDFKARHLIVRTRSQRLLGVLYVLHQHVRTSAAYHIWPWGHACIRTRSNIFRQWTTGGKVP